MPKPARSHRTTGRTPVGHLLAHAAGAALLVNAVPHGVHGLSGKRFQSPFGRPPGVGESSPETNVVWSGANAIGGAALLFGVGRFRFGANADTVVTLASAWAAGIAISRYFAGVRGTR
ncbi:hypothetical protein ARHIZOSPH14_17090 [Agromyces rhizosphaerae]|uniref:Uncharacterized protein n=1 Tax=Agromyces rhizosphaerae TaxID=88374 RepID=A0A9W6FRA8_9MICO|nr:hypothetical protein [Agromyces rhizosphaerae]GLI27467.1 hypothetical protein ARHIZOSPH14_17090 [Agromyces rhizosphaerae]